MLHNLRLEKMLEAELKTESDAQLNETELERLADFYHERGFFEEAIKTLEELMAARYDREYQAVRHIRRAS
ncbi:MAG: hypothetical protein JST89_15725 [Cyanobacteria bacterium SZAS-4]|nr:hypothetical protein [Cyanobacteria bacterium SZAS-4]